MIKHKHVELLEELARQLEKNEVQIVLSDSDRRFVKNIFIYDENETNENRRKSWEMVKIANNDAIATAITFDLTNVLITPDTLKEFLNTIRMVKLEHWTLVD